MCFCVVLVHNILSFSLFINVKFDAKSKVSPDVPSGDLCSFRWYITESPFQVSFKIELSELSPFYY